VDGCKFGVADCVAGYAADAADDVIEVLRNHRGSSQQSRLELGLRCAWPSPTGSDWMLQLSARRACACGNAVFSGVASTADFNRQDFKEINIILSLTSPSALACKST
jgi:hypothetical protein